MTYVMTRLINTSVFVCLLPVIIALTGCGDGANNPAKPTFKPIDESTAVFWDRQTKETGEFLRGLIDEYNQQRPQDMLPIKVEHIGGYTEIFRKVSASIQARALPSMAVSYESMTTEYIEAGAAMALDAWFTDPERGLSEAERADFFPVVLETNQYASFGGKMYSFPFAKSILMLYFNKKVLSACGYTTPPETWDAFLEQCRAVKAKTGKPAYALSVDCSTLDGWIYSMGGEIVKDQTTLFDSPESIRVFELIETLAEEELAYQISPGTFEDQAALYRGDVAFIFRTSSSRTGLKDLFGNRQDEWGIARVPQADPQNPHTLLFGPNICIFRTTDVQQQAAWDFVKYFTSPKMSVRWALGTGYMPIRKSSIDDPDLQKFWAEWPYNRAAFDCLPFAKPEPNLLGWQQIRNLVETAETEVMTQVKTGRQAALDLKEAADAVLAQNSRPS